MKVGIKYCGGCNPRFDRVAGVNKLKAEFPQAEFVSAAGALDCDIVLVVCGCFSACADKTGLAAKEEIMTIWQNSDLDRVREKLYSLRPEWKEAAGKAADGAAMIGFTKTEEARAAEAAQAESLARADKAEQEEAARWMRMVMPLSGK